MEKKPPSKPSKVAAPQTSTQPLDLSRAGPSGVAKAKPKKGAGKVQDNVKKPPIKRPASAMATEPVNPEEPTRSKIAKKEKNDVSIFYTYTYLKPH